MSQDTRKDPRAKIVSLNVRYKSATVDEFIDNHASDVSKGGIFIKTSTPFPQGTLLKFEIRLAGDQSVIAGVGRVVWKREPGAAGAGPDRAAGMGVKFIKLDDASRAVIDRLAASREDAGSAFTSELESDVTQVDQKGPAGMTGASALKSTIAGVGPGPSAKPTLQGMPAQSSPPRPAAGSIVKSTIVGMPAVQPPKEEPKPAAPAAASASGGFFPAGSGSEADMPPAAERTVMKQAAELLEEALKEAGGSMDEVGTNPLFEKSATPPPAEARKFDADAPTLANEAPKGVAETKAAPTETVALPKPITSQPILASDRARSLSSSRPAAVSAKSYVEEPTRKPSMLPFIALAVVVLGAGGFGAYKAGLFGGGAPVDTGTPPLPTPSVTMSAPPINSAMPMTDASVAAVPETADGGAAGMAAKDAGAAMPTVAATAKPAPTYHAPKPHPTATATATDEPVDTSAPTATTTAPTPAPTDTSTTPTPTAAPTPTAVPTPAPTGSTTKGTKPADDNPY